MEASIRLEHELLAVETENEVHGMIELVAPPAPAGKDGEGPRPQLHLALVIDRSGSMHGEKLETAGACVDYLIQRLAPNDEVAVVTYDSEVMLNVPLQTKAQLNGLQIAPYLKSGGQTNLSGGWLKGAEVIAGDSQANGGPRKVILLSDGQANVGVTDPGALEQMSRKTVEASGVQTTTIGFGDGFDEDLMTAMADAGRGNAYYAATVEEAPAIFAEEFEGLVSLVAQNVSVEIRPGPDVEVVEVLNDYPMVNVAGGVQVQLGDAYGEERRRVVFRMRVPQMAALGVATVAELVVRYVSVGTQIESHELHVPVTVNLVSADEAAAAGPDAEVTEEVVVLKAAKAQLEAREQADAGDIEGARKTLKLASDDLRMRAPDSTKGQELLEQAEQLDENALMMMTDYDASTRKTMTYQSRLNQRRRPKEPGN